MRIVLDTNILISALITKDTPPDRLYQAWLRGEIELVTSSAQIAEITEVLSRPRMQRLLDADEAGSHSREPRRPCRRPRQAAACEPVP